jgi:hypothetical protein
MAAAAGGILHQGRGDVEEMRRWYAAHPLSEINADRID